MAKAWKGLSVWNNVHLDDSRCDTINAAQVLQTRCLFFVSGVELCIVLHILDVTTDSSNNVSHGCGDFWYVAEGTTYASYNIFREIAIVPHAKGESIESTTVHFRETGKVLQVRSESIFKVFTVLFNTVYRSRIIVTFSMAVTSAVLRANPGDPDRSRNTPTSTSLQVLRPNQMQYWKGRVRSEHPLRT